MNAPADGRRFLGGKICGDTAMKNDDMTKENGRCKFCVRERLKLESVVLIQAQEEEIMKIDEVGLRNSSKDKSFGWILVFKNKKSMSQQD